jgi:hypothetical protein
MNVQTAQPSDAPDRANGALRVMAMLGLHPMAEVDQALPMADRERERTAVELFPVTQSPEEYAARNAHLWVSFSFDDYRYQVLNTWIQRRGDIFFGRNRASSISELREKCLALEERQHLEAEGRGEI